MTTVMEYLDEYPVMFMFLLMGLGMLLGRLKIGGIGLEAAAVLFLAIGVSALGAHLGIRVTIDEELGTVGLAIFAFAIGNSAGKSFFRSLKQASGPIAMMISVFIVAAGVAAAAEPADGAAVVFGQLAQGGQIGAVGKLNVMRGGGGQGEGGAVNQRMVVLEGEHGFQAA